MTAQGKKKEDQAKNKGKISAQLVIKKESKCFFCKKKGHMKKDCSKFKTWLDKKGTPLLLFVMNIIWLMLIITHGGLILLLQSMFLISCRVWKI